MVRGLLVVGMAALLGMLGLPKASTSAHFSPAEAQAEPPFVCTIRPTEVRTCAHFQGCDYLLTYSQNTQLQVVDTVTGDRNNGVDQWLVIEDPVQRTTGYIHSLDVQACEPDAWQTKPVIPAISQAARDVYARGMAMGNDPHAFSKVGDCQNVEAYFLSNFDSPGQYDLGNYQSLQTTIDNFTGSFARESAAVQSGFTVASVLSPLWSDPAVCQGGENPLECEERLHNPSIAIISMETWNRAGQQPVSLYEAYLSQVVEFWMEQGVVPILATKADNLEGDGSINAAVARVAEKYDMPLWNFWLASQSLPGHGFDPALSDGFHLLWARSFYNNPDRLRDGWPVRNLTALEAIDAVWRAAQEQ
ncbi:MAG: hypothetical protein IT319_03525 [Anaerolineae bacterium]|nr:hypothetical protein [Anaerolineae bacterium]